MKPLTFVHVSDSHLATDPAWSGPLTDILPRPGAEALLREIAALPLPIDFVLHTGDVHSDPERPEEYRQAADLYRQLRMPVYFLPGNHDPLDASSVYTSPAFTRHKPDNVVVLGDSSPVEAASGVELLPAPWFTKRPLADLVAEACDASESSDAVHILVGHGAVDTLAPDQTRPGVISLSALERGIGEGRIRYAALGDRHSSTDVGRTGRTWYSGAPEPTDYDEVDPGNVLVVDIGADQVSVEKHPVGTWQFLRKDWEVTGDADLDALEDWLNGIEGKDRAIVKLALVGQVSLAQKARLDSLLEHHADLLAALDTWERRSELAVVPDDADLILLGLSGFAMEALEDLGELAESSGEQAVAARDAMALLHRLVGAES